MMRITRALGMLHCIPARWYLTVAYWLETGRWIDWDKPETFSDKLQWLKLYGGTQRYAHLVDKAAVRDWVAQLIGREYLVPSLGAYDRPEQIPWHALPDRCVIKCTHGSHCGIVLDGKAPPDRQAVIRKLRKWQRRNWYWFGREPAYRDLAPRILIERYLGGDDPPDDYKIMCFSGRAEVVQLHRKSGRETRIDFFDRNGVRIDMRKPGYRRSQRLEIPHCDLAKLLPVAERIASAIDVPYVRVDLYLVRGQVYFGEVTFFDSAGFRPFEPEAAEAWLGSLIDIRRGS